MRVAICALTFHRPAGLRALLEGIARLEVPEDVRVEVVIVDNDEERSAEDAVVAASGSFPLPLRYFVEPERGIAPARNRAVEVALESGNDFVAFIDDDEVPDARWLVELVRVQAQVHADVVTGPVLPVFEEPPPAWAVQGAFFERPRFTTGTRLTYARTSNVLISAALLTSPPAPFDVRFGLNGGDDTHFFMRVRLAGAHIAWADEAVVSEVVPPSRVSVRWVTRRAYRRGNTLSLCLRDLRDTWPNRARRTAAAGFHVAAGIGRLLAAVIRGRACAAAGAAQVAYGFGLASGLVGVRYDEYRTIHGS
ncbi:MAG: glycosyltransferase family 2 protein [Microthrixaceae bacterium]